MSEQRCEICKQLCRADAHEDCRDGAKAYARAKVEEAVRFVYEYCDLQRSEKGLDSDRVSADIASALKHVGLSDE